MNKLTLKELMAADWIWSGAASMSDAAQKVFLKALADQNAIPVADVVGAFQNAKSDPRLLKDKPVQAGQRHRSQPRASGLQGRELAELNSAMGIERASATTSHRDPTTGALVLPSATPTEIRDALRTTGGAR